jgi:RNA polymerase sigma-70 factor (ECF subfamily)
MTDPAGDTTHLLHQLNAGNEMARNDLFHHACKRLRCLTREMLRVYPGVRSWEETGDILQNALIRLDRATSEVPLDPSQHFWNLAALQVRRELIDLARRHLGREGHGANHHTEGLQPSHC